MVVLPTGERLTSRRFRQLGLLLGMSTGAERLHYIVEQPTDSLVLHTRRRASKRVRGATRCSRWCTSVHADGCVTGWSAERMLPEGAR